MPARVHACALVQQATAELAESAALDLLRRRERQRIAEGDVPRSLVVGEPGEAELDDVARQGRRSPARPGSRLAHDTGQDLVASHRVRHRRDACGGDGRVLQQHASRPPSPICSRRCAGSGSSCDRRSGAGRSRPPAPGRRCGTSHRARRLAVACSSFRYPREEAEPRPRTAVAHQQARRDAPTGTSSPAASMSRYSTPLLRTPEAGGAHLPRFPVGDYDRSAAGLCHRPGFDAAATKPPLERGMMPTDSRRRRSRNAPSWLAVLRRWLAQRAAWPASRRDSA